MQFIETEPGTPPWAYTVGLSSYGHPELVVTGMLHPFNQQLLNGLAARVLDGEAPEPGLRLALADGPTIEWVAVRKPAAHLHTACSFSAAGCAPCRQCTPTIEARGPRRSDTGTWSAGNRSGVSAGTD